MPSKPRQTKEGIFAAQQGVSGEYRAYSFIHHIDLCSANSM